MIPFAKVHNRRFMVVEFDGIQPESSPSSMGIQPESTSSSMAFSRNPSFEWPVGTWPVGK